MKSKHIFRTNTFVKYFLGIISLYFFVIVNPVHGQAANHVVISEVGPMTGSSSKYNTGEFIELYNPLSVDVTLGANVVITSGEAAGSNAAAWSVSLSGKTIKAFGFLLIGDGGVKVTPDVSFPANKNLANSGTRSYVQLKNGTDLIDAFGWDPASVSSPNCEGTALKPSGTSSDGKTFERKSGSTATAHDTEGNAWDSNDNSKDFFENTSATANPQNSSSPIAKNPYNVPTSTGPGAVTVTPSRWKFNNPTNLTFVVKSSDNNIVGLKLVKPGLFNWNSNSISVKPSTVSINQSADTSAFSNFSLSGSDSVVITISNVTSSDSTDEFSFTVLTSTDGSSFQPIKTAPTTLVYGLPKSVATIKTKQSGGGYSYQDKWVVTKAVVTAANEFKGPSYLQDATAGLAIFDSSVTNHVELGDEIVVLGKVSPFYNLFELSPASILETTDEGVSYDTLTLTIPQVKSQNQNGVEPYEAKLIRINNISKVLTASNSTATKWSVTGSGTNYNLVSGSDTIQVRISPNVNLVNLSIPSGKFDIVGVLGKYFSTYQLMPRSYTDIISEGAGPQIISGAPFESTMSPTSITFDYKTDTPGTSIVRFGKTNSYGSTDTDTSKVTQHHVVVNGLEPSTVYHVQIGSANSNGTTYTSDYIVETSSLTSTGTINVFFNHSIDKSVSAGEDAQVTDISQEFIHRINSAQYSIDVALYSLSGTVGANIANALISAKNRGVKVRVIGEYDNHSTAPWSTLSTGGISVIFDNFDTKNNGNGLMHNKFGVFDNRDSTDTNDWIWSGSWNATDPGNNNDAQNVIEIQDKSLANAYRIEFEEMWGSDTDTPNAANSHFGADKIDNTPHRFNIAGTPVELYFDPSDNTTSHIGSTLNASVSSINIAMLTFTRSDLAQILVNKKNAGEKVHVILDNKTDTGNQFSFLENNGVDIRLKGSAVAGLLHHKYAIVDGEKTSSDRVVITGSHNWSSSAENSNNENTLIIHSARIANLYLQEFKARYIEAGGTDVISDVKDNSSVPANFELKQNYPNPFNPSTVISYQLPKSSFVTLKVYDILGREIATLVNEYQHAGNYQRLFSIDSKQLSSGIYLYRIVAGDFIQSKKMLLLK